jgi:hypothetical protein
MESIDNTYEGNAWRGKFTFIRVKGNVFNPKEIPKSWKYLTSYNENLWKEGKPFIRNPQKTLRSTKKSRLEAYTNSAPSAL